MQHLLILYKYCTNVVCTFGVLATIEILPEEPGATPVESGEGSSGAWRTLQWILKKAPVKSGERSSAQCVHWKVGWNRIQKRTVKYTNLCLQTIQRHIQLKIENLEYSTRLMEI